MLVTLDNASELAWEKMQGMIPAIIQHADTGAVLMQGFMNKDALDKTLEISKATFFSRSKQRLWTKGETSNNTLDVQTIYTDCDKDSLLLVCRPNGPTCHLGYDSCFPEQEFNQKHFLSLLEQVVKQRQFGKPEDSYTAKLLSQGTKRSAQKVGEEGVEVALAAATGDRDELLQECADLFYHTLVLLRDQDVDLSEVMAVLENRHR
ncbi:bifunctional phosphoribosyl-AMP cyclohydrolase/phosphoribosyl-ATP diphosphatase HisIE [Thalassotalea mangrovi]|uniref:Histidine biosynthesis bifunctional protein HisIE n=1 Tax=Thalassotalea mangrovi TaxID=2572245 RepID=A0A4U1B2G8_9GAMM|nr:bifunctional phosphoribosyl-AMP cyclohydrolase/phosphoribosyl-ATP diphosphatase HisIE [Thalassotalea mangrovi]TKB43651.1 bifunctional phosphoribosyl-AMP cyclohydrolase/phosphoribosyl-ATP diphosphatase HisIE [Thalassotalea mangrovi]